MKVLAHDLMLALAREHVDLAAEHSEEKVHDPLKVGFSWLHGKNKPKVKHTKTCDVCVLLLRARRTLK